MQTFRVSTGLRRWAPTMAVVALGLALQPWQLKAQTNEEPQAQSPAVPLVQSKEPQQKVGGYENIKVGVYGLHIIDAAIANSANLPAFQGVFGTDTGVNQEFKANQFFLLDITGRNFDDLQLVKGVAKIRSKDDRGKALIAPGTSTFLLTPSPQHFTPSAQRLAKDTPLKITLPFEMEDGAKSVKTLEGELVVVNGVVRTLTFTAAELQTGASKHAGAVSITLDGVHRTNGHFDIFATVTSVQFDPGSGLHISLGPMGRNTDVRVEVMGTDGIPYNNIGMGETVQPGRPAPPAAGANAKAGSLIPKISQVKVIFGREETPRRPQTVTFHIIESQGEPVYGPFKFTDLPLAEKH